MQDNLRQFAQILNNIEGIQCRTNVLASSLTTIKVGGLIPFLFTIDSESALKFFVSTARTSGIEICPLGFGSNSLFPDENISSCFFRLAGEFQQIKDLGLQQVEAGAGVGLMQFSRRLGEQGLSGLEFAGGIPGSLGGATWMNAGAHGHEIAELIVQIKCINQEGEIVIFEARDLNFTYRSIRLPRGFVVISTRLKLASGDPANILAERTRCLEYRKATQPLQLPSFGSVFQNPSPEIAAGQVLDQLGFKGLAVGGAEFSKLHANWIVNPSRRATYKDVLSLISTAQKRVNEQLNIVLETEVVDWGKSKTA